MSIQIIDESENFSTVSPWFPEDEDLESEILSIIAVLGPERTGKTTLINRIFETDLKEGVSSLTTTTKGVHAAKSKTDSLSLVLDIEGLDARDEKGFATAVTCFAYNLADVIMLNIQYHDVGHLHSAAYTALEVMFTEAITAQKNDPQEPGDVITKIIWIVRDVDAADPAQLEEEESEMREILMNDATEMWKSMTEKDQVSLTIDDVFEFDVFVLPHFKFQPDLFQLQCEQLKKTIAIKNDPEFCLHEALSKNVPADGVAAFSNAIWDNLKDSIDAHNTAQKEASTVGATDSSATAGRDPSQSSIESQMRTLPPEELVGSPDAVLLADDAFSEVLAKATEEVDNFENSLAEGQLVDDLGSKSDQIMTAALEGFDAKTASLSDSRIVMRKRRELEEVVDKYLYQVYKQQLQLLRESAIHDFKTGLTAEDSPSDFSLFGIDGNFVSKAQASMRPGAAWAFENERSALHGVFQDLSTQRMKLLKEKVNAGRQQQQAMQYLQLQQAQLQHMQQSHYQASTGNWNFGAAYRPPETNLNLSLSYHQGKTSIQVSMVPDEQQGYLGPQGFTGGVGPGNLGLSLNMNV